MKSIALCLNLPDIYEPNIGKKYPGAGWVPHFLRLAEDAGYEVIEGKRQESPKDCIVVQEENNGYGRENVLRGGDPRVLLCLESPLFASPFYETIPIYFKHQLLFSGGTEHIWFPSFDNEDVLKTPPWLEKDLVCMVTANKHYRMLGNVSGDAWKEALTGQLHDHRYLAIDYFKDKPGFKLYGKGWGDFAPECDDKLQTIKNYRFALCFENGSYPGYVTEKLIDCLVAGVIPIYRGAPDIYKSIPGWVYLPAFNYETLDDLYEDITSMSAWTGQSMIERGQAWLTTPSGQMFTNLRFAQRILELCA